MRYEINAGRVLTWSLETHLVDHCNLRCAHCCTLSPHLPPRAVDPERLERDLALAAGALRPNLFKVTGGEPLLHPQLVRCLQAVRRSGIAEAVSLTTNGLLLAQVPDEAFALLDRLTLSHYSSAPLPGPALASLRERCARHGVVLTVKPIDRFQRMDADPPHAEERAVREVHAACWLRNRCHLLHGGRLYTCTRPPHLEARLGRPLAEADGVALEGADLLARLLRYLESEEPLLSCRFCLGASGPWEPHRQLGRPA